MRLADGFISMQSGPEIGVASTKAFTAPLVDLYMLAILLADLRGTTFMQERKQLVSDLRLVPDLVGQCLEREDEIINIAKKYQDVRDMFFLGGVLICPLHMRVR